MDYFYTCTEEFDTTDCQDRDEAIGLALARIPQDQWPETLTVYRWRHVAIETMPLMDPIIATTVQMLDRLYRPPGHRFDPDQWSKDDTREIKNAVHDFIRVLAVRYPVEALEPVDSEKIVVADWVAQHNG